MARQTVAGGSGRGFARQRDCRRNRIPGHSRLRSKSQGSQGQGSQSVPRPSHHAGRDRHGSETGCFYSYPRPDVATGARRSIGCRRNQIHARLQGHGWQAGDTPMKLAGKAKMLRIHFGEDDKWQGKPLYRAIVEKCRELDIAGATVYRGIEGYGASTLIHRPHLLSFSSDAPIMVSIVDTNENIQKLIPTLDQMVDEGLIAISDVEVIKYVHQEGVRS